MGRPREHDDRTRDALLVAAERIVEAEGVEALSVRRVAEEIDTSTRAVYSVFGSKDGLLTALGVRAFEHLADAVGGQRLTSDHRRNLAIAGLGYRTFALEHTALMRIGVQRAVPDPAQATQWAHAANATFGILVARCRAFIEAQGLSLDPQEAAVEYHALCEGLSQVELRGMMRAGTELRHWKRALTALVDGFAAAG